MFYWCHCSPTAGHQGMSRTIAKIKESFLWPGLNRYIRQQIASCGVCVQKSRNVNDQRFYTSENTSGFKFQRVSIDLVGPMPPASFSINGTKFKYILTVLDTFTKHLTCIPVESKEAQCIARHLERSWLNVYGIPWSIRSDLGGEFTAELVKEVLQFLGIYHVFQIISKFL